MPMNAVLPIFLFIACAAVLATGLLVISLFVKLKRPGAVKRMPYESGMDPLHDTRRRFDVRFHLMAIAFLVFDVELLFLYPWAVAMRPAALAGGRCAEATAAPGTRPRSAQGIDAAVPRRTGRQP